MHLCPSPADIPVYLLKYLVILSAPAVMLAVTTHGQWHMHGRVATVRTAHLEKAVPPATRVHVQWMVFAA